MFLRPFGPLEMSKLQGPLGQESLNVPANSRVKVPLGRTTGLPVAEEKLCLFAGEGRSTFRPEEPRKFSPGLSQA